MTARRLTTLLPWLILLGCIAALAVAAIGILHPAGTADGPHRTHAAATKPALPAEPLPPVEPLIVRDVSPDDARAINAAVPFVAGPIPAARPFVFPGIPSERERALTCLGAAVWYEAGDDAVGEQAVAQVVLNRLRHPAYPKSVCGVVFQGSERKTGCQFTFSCDGALTRRPSAIAWQRAREIAGRALGGFVFKPVGTATHYHTDWVVPYWSATLDKIAMVHTHIFFRWKGGWGRPDAFTRAYQGPEPLDARIAWLADPAVAGPLPGGIVPPLLAGGDAGPPPRDELFIPGLPTAALKGAIVRLMDEGKSEFGLQLDPAAFPGSYGIVALGICKARPTCTVMGWTRPERIPPALPVPPAVLRTVSFLYRKQAGHEDVYFNCRQIPRDNPAQCLPGTEPDPPAKPAAAAAAADPPRPVP